MLIVGGAVACVVILAGSTGPVQGYFAYGGAAVGASRGGRQPVSELLITSSTSIVCCALLVAAILVIALRRSDAGRGASHFKAEGRLRCPTSLCTTTISGWRIKRVARARESRR